jgi:Flp pilus assembly protein TadD
MFKMLLKSILVSVFALSFSACSTNQAELDKKASYENHIKMVKKRKQREKRMNKHKASKTKASKFCFKDSSSIHYRASQRCK